MSEVEYKSTTKKKLWEKNIKLNKLIDDIECSKQIVGDYSDANIIDSNEWASYLTHEDFYEEKIKEIQETSDFWSETSKKFNLENMKLKEEKKKLKEQVDEQHRELQEIKNKLKDILG